MLVGVRRWEASPPSKLGCCLADGVDGECDEEDEDDPGGDSLAEGVALWGGVGGGDGDGLADGVAGDAEDGVVYHFRAVTILILGGGDVDGVALGALGDVDGVVEVDGVVADGGEVDGVAVGLLGGEGDVAGGAASCYEEEEDYDVQICECEDVRMVAVGGEGGNFHGMKI